MEKTFLPLIEIVTRYYHLQSQYLKQFGWFVNLLILPFATSQIASEVAWDITPSTNRVLTPRVASILTGFATFALWIIVSCEIAS